MMKPLCRTALALGLAALLTAPALAQQGRGRGGRFGGGGPAALLGNASVQKELNLDEKQIEKGQEIAKSSAEKQRENFEATRDLEGQERFAKMRELNQELQKENFEAIREFLKPEQVKRLGQIHHQQQGAMALAEPYVAKKLNLTDAQKEEIQTVLNDSRQEMRQIFQDSQGDREGARAKMLELRKSTLSKAEEKLNDDQKKIWKDELLGSPFEVKYEGRGQGR